MSATIDGVPIGIGVALSKESMAPRVRGVHCSVMVLEYVLKLLITPVMVLAADLPIALSQLETLILPGMLGL